jgi:1-acyl-sn-glycerol-3-phosphate acyltransferase
MVETRSKMQRTLFGIWTWLAFALVSAIGFVGCALVFLATFWFDPTRKHTGAAIRAVGRAMFWCAPMWTVRCLGPIPEHLPERTICVSNHASNVDPFLLVHLPWEMKFLAKSALFLIPFVGWGMKIAGDIPLDRGSPKSARAALARAKFYIERGMPVLFFPEGTRSPTGQLLPFKDGAFRLAVESNAAILPIAVAGTRDLLKKGDFWPSRARARVAVGVPIATAGVGLAEVARLKEETRTAIEHLLVQLS